MKDKPLDSYIQVFMDFRMDRRGFLYLFAVITDTTIMEGSLLPRRPLRP